MFHWRAGAGICLWRFLEPQLLQTLLFTAKACSPDRLNRYIISDTFNQTSRFSGFYVLFQTSSPPGKHALSRNKYLHLRSLFPHSNCAEMSIDCYFQLRVLKLNQRYFRNAFTFTELRVEPAERRNDLPQVKHELGAFVWMQNPSTLLPLSCLGTGEWWRPRRKRGAVKWWINTFHLPHIFRRVSH